MSSFAYLTLTTGIAGLILLLVFSRRLKDIRKSTLKRALILSAFLVCSLLSEKEGLRYLPSSNASFISALNILFVPAMLLIVGSKPSRNNVTGIIVILAGLCMTKGFMIREFLNQGTVFMALSCLCIAGYTIAADRYTKQEDPLLIGVVQIWFSALIGFILWFIEEPSTFASLTYSNEMLSCIFILAFFSKAYAYIMLMYSQKFTDPISVTIIASLEPVVTLFLALLIPNSRGETETFSSYSLVGACMIATGAIIAGTHFLEHYHPLRFHQEGARQ